VYLLRLDHQALFLREALKFFCALLPSTRAADQCCDREYGFIILPILWKFRTELSMMIRSIYQIIAERTIIERHGNTKVGHRFGNKKELNRVMDPESAPSIAIPVCSQKSASLSLSVYSTLNDCRWLYQPLFRGRVEPYLVEPSCPCVVSPEL
jgi:hypothetical protein